MKKMIVAIFLCLFIGMAFTQEVTETKGDGDFIGEIILFAGTYAPINYVDCDGRSLAINEYMTLYALIGTQFGGDGVTYFNVPDLRGRVPVGQGQGVGLTPKYTGQQGGYESVALNSTQIPSHSHSGTVNSTGSVMCDTGAGNDDSPSGNSPARAEIDIYSTNTATTPMQNGTIQTTGSFTTDASGSGVAHQNMQPYLTIRYCICYDGLWPQRP